MRPYSSAVQHFLTRFGKVTNRGNEIEGGLRTEEEFQQVTRMSEWISQANPGSAFGAIDEKEN